MSDITISPEAIEAAAIELAPAPWSMYTEDAREHFRRKASAVCIAMLKAWPGSYSLTENDSAEIRDVAAIILPLTENTND